MVNNRNLVSAEVLLNSATGRVVEPNTLLTAETIHDYMPSPETQERAKAGFEALGFEVSAPAGLGFSITGTTALFEKTFKTRLVRDDRGGILATHPGGSKERTIPINSLGKLLRRLLIAVTFAEPPAFGPGQY